MISALEAIEGSCANFHLKFLQDSADKWDFSS